MNVNPAYRTHELEYALNAADIVALFLIDRFRDADYVAILASVRARCSPCIAPAGTNLRSNALMNRPWPQSPEPGTGCFGPWPTRASTNWTISRCFFP